MIQEIKDVSNSQGVHHADTPSVIVIESLSSFSPAYSYVIQQGNLSSREICRSAIQLPAYMTSAPFPLASLQCPLRAPGACEVVGKRSPEECLRGKLASLKRKLPDESVSIDQPLMDTWPSM